MRTSDGPPGISKLMRLLSALPDPVKVPFRPAVRRYRFATRSLRILPSFLVIGAQRAGTTTLFYYLQCHPEIAAPKSSDKSVYWLKELHFFDKRFGMGLDWYRSFFPLDRLQRRARRRGGDLVPGEGTPSYLFHPLVPERVRATLPDVRLVALLRDPIERAYSHYQHMVRMGRERLSFDAAVAAETKRLARERPRLLTDSRFRAYHHRNHSYVSRSLYAEQLERWFEHFPREQFLILRAEDFRARPAGVYAEVLAFLGVDAWSPGNFPARNVGAYAPIDPELRARLEERFAEPNAHLARLVGRDFGWPVTPGGAALPAGAGPPESDRERVRR